MAASHLIPSGSGVSVDPIFTLSVVLRHLSGCHLEPPSPLPSSHRSASTRDQCTTATRVKKALPLWVPGKGQRSDLPSLDTASSPHAQLPAISHQLSRS